MRAKIGDVVIDKTYNKKGNLAIVVGEGISQPILIDHNGGIARDKLRDYFAVWDGLEVIGHIDFERIWEEAVRKADHKTENSSEKPNNCDTCRNKGVEGCEQPCLGCGCCGLYEPKDEPTTQTETQNSNLTFEKRTMLDCYNCKRFETEDECIECHYEPKDEPQTDSEITRNSLRKDCNGCRFVGSYDTEFPCANCTRKNKDYYTSEQTEREGE